jgi:hypothetical protein
VDLKVLVEEPILFKPVKVVTNLDSNKIDDNELNKAHGKLLISLIHMQRTLKMIMKMCMTIVVNLLTLSFMLRFLLMCVFFNAFLLFILFCFIYLCCHIRYEARLKTKGSSCG